MIASVLDAVIIHQVQTDRAAARAGHNRDYVCIPGTAHIADRCAADPACRCEAEIRCIDAGHRFRKSDSKSHTGSGGGIHICARNSDDVWKFHGRHEILYRERRSVGGVCCIAAEELHIILVVIVVVIQGKAQPELSWTADVNEWEGSRVERGGVPDGCLGVFDRADSRKVRGGLKVGRLQVDRGVKERLLDVHQDVPMRGKGIRTDNSLLLDLEGHPGDDRVVGERCRAEVQEGAILLVVVGIPKEERTCPFIDPDPRFVGFAGFDDPAIVRARRLVGCCGRDRDGQLLQEDIVPSICIVRDQAVVEGGERHKLSIGGERGSERGISGRLRDP